MIIVKKMQFFFAKTGGDYPLHHVDWRGRDPLHPTHPCGAAHGPSPDGRFKVQAKRLAQMEGTSPDRKSQLKQKTLRPDGKLLCQLEGPSAQTGGNQRK